MSEIIQDRYIFLNENHTSKEDIFSFIGKKAEEYGICDSASELVQDLFDREKEFSTGLQDGFAIPHARTNHVKRVAVFFIRNASNIEWETLDDSDVHYLFVLLVPSENEGNIHLQMISKLATSLLEDEFKETIKNSDDVSSLKEYILENIQEKGE